MATVQQLINRSLRLIGVLAAGETPEATETSDALVSLNAMLDSWRNDKLMVYALTNQAVTLINGTSTYTIGATGGTVATSPVEVISAFVRQSNVDYNLRPLTDAEYQSKASKNITADIPSEYLFTHTHPNATVILYPVPTVANTMYLRIRTPYSAFTAASDTVSLPPGFERAIAYNLALELYPEYPSIQVNQVVVKIANDSLAGIKRLNSKVPKLVTQLAPLNRYRTHDIYAGE